MVKSWGTAYFLRLQVPSFSATIPATIAIAPVMREIND
jgi:hypothetical protein